MVRDVASKERKGNKEVRLKKSPEERIRRVTHNLLHSSVQRSEVKEPVEFKGCQNAMD